ncbi:MAG: exodeoxyribonuclease VII large subunit, partial [Xanthomonadales bacterium]|nr:exodeoxyribonuclease VII large subunit [Xanthomonadales bacterium]
AGFPVILLEAEISNLARPASGHLYFTLKDNGAQIKCAMFRSAASRVSIRAENGMNVLARGRVSLYEPRGDYQFIVDGLQDAGEGALQRRFEELKKKLEAEGLFERAHKRELPTYPSRIGLITSPSGAAVRDLLHVLQRRWPVAQVRLYPVPVQGVEAPAKIRDAIEAARRHRWADILIIGRGGGSLEDLLAFNDEGVARAVFASDIPVISAVGHETDFSICDFVADLRAPTPSAAAELATPDQLVLKEVFQRTHRQLQRRIRDRLHRDSQRLDHVSHRLQQQHPAARLSEQSRRLESLSGVLRRAMHRFLAEPSTRLENLSGRLKTHRPDRRLLELSDRVNKSLRSLDTLMRTSMNFKREKLAELARTLNAVSPLETMGRGYAVVTDSKSGELVSSISQLETGDRVSTRLKDGTFEGTVDSVRA